MTDFNANSKPTPPNMPWFKCFQDAWLEGTRNLKPEQRGIYFDCLCLLYKFGTPLKRDDKWMSHQLHVPVRTWQRLKRELIASGKLVEIDGALSNARAEKEVAAQHAVREKTADKRAKTSEKLQTKTKFNSENANDFSGTTGESIEDRVKKGEEEKKDSQPAAVECDAAPRLAAGWLDDFSIVNLFNELADGDAPKAERWLIENQHLGTAAIREAGERVKAERIAGKRVVDPLKLSASIAQRLKAGGQSITDRKPPVDVGARTREIIANALRMAEQEASA